MLGRTYTLSNDGTSLAVSDASGSLTITYHVGDFNLQVGVDGYVFTKFDIQGGVLEK